MKLRLMFKHLKVPCKMEAKAAPHEEQQQLQLATDACKARANALANAATVANSVEFALTQLADPSFVDIVAQVESARRGDPKASKVEDSLWNQLTAWDVQQLQGMPKFAVVLDATRLAMERIEAAAERWTGASKKTTTTREAGGTVTPDEVPPSRDCLESQNP